MNCRCLAFFNNRAGWVLVDSIIGITIISLGLLAIIAAYIQTTKTASYSDNATQATYLAQQKLEKIKKDFDGSSSPAACPSPADPPNGIFSFVCSAVNPATPVTGLNIVSITYQVNWLDASSAQNRSISLAAYYYYFDS